MMVKKWKCKTCGSITHHKGLCRECTEYDGDGNIVTPVARVRINSDGTDYVKVERIRDTNEMANLRQNLLNQRRKKLTKKQRKLAEAEMKAMLEAQKELADEETNSEGIIEFGEEVEEE